MVNLAIGKLAFVAIQVVAYILYYVYTKRNFGIQDSNLGCIPAKPGNVR